MLHIVLCRFHASIVKDLVVKIGLNFPKWWTTAPKVRAAIPVVVWRCCFRAKCAITQRNKTQIVSNSSKKAISSLSESQQKLGARSYSLKQKTVKPSLPIRTFGQSLLLTTHLENNQQQCWLLSRFFRFHASQILLDRCSYQIWYRAIFFVCQRLQFFLRLRIHYCFNLLS